jgi:hypothetical protein
MKTTLYSISMLAVAMSLPIAVPAEPAAAPKNKPELAPDKELLAKIEALADNTWLKLPPSKRTGDMGVLSKDPDYKRAGPFVRDFCNRMVWAPERRRALYCGGGHNVHPWNDVWEFDLAANTWVCLYGADPAPPRLGPGKEAEAEAWYKANAVVKDGVIRTPRGGPLRPCHTWWSLCYDSDRKRLLFVESHKGLFATDKAALAKAHNLDPKGPMLQTYGSGAGEAWLLSFDPDTGAWREVLTKVPKAGESSMLEYLPDQKTLWWLSGTTYLYEPAAPKEWKPVAKDGPKLGGESAYDPETKKVVVTLGLQTWVFSCEKNTWTLVHENAPDGGYVPASTFCYDSTAKKFVLYTHLKLKDKDAGARLWLYDVKENKWTAPAPPGAGPTVTNVAGYYDPARNVTVIYSNGETWVYRAKKAVR